MNLLAQAIQLWHSSKNPLTTLLGWAAGLVIINKISFAQVLEWITIRSTDPEALWNLVVGAIAIATGTLCYNPKTKREEVIVLTDIVDTDNKEKENV